MNDKIEYLIKEKVMASLFEEAMKADQETDVPLMYKQTRRDTFQEARIIVCDMPATHIVKYAEWIYGENDSGKDGIFCSYCCQFVPWDYEYYKNPNELIAGNLFCPHCGAFMKKE